MPHTIFSLSALRLCILAAALGAAVAQPAGTAQAAQPVAPTGPVAADAVDIAAATVPAHSQQSPLSRNSQNLLDAHDAYDAHNSKESKNSKGVDSSQDFSSKPPGFLRCQVAYGGTTRTLDTYPGTNAYTAEPVDIDGRFLFKAVVRSTAGQVDAIKLYVYQAASPRPVLLHEARYVPPFAASTVTADGAAGRTTDGASNGVTDVLLDLSRSLTGEHTVIAPPLERQLHFGCAWMGAR